jgi:hypothetical protein
MELIKSVKAAIFKMAWALGYKIERVSAPPPPHYLQRDERYASIMNAAEPFTMTTYESMGALIDATRYVTQAKILGAIVECGVWRGGSMMISAMTLLESGDIRDLYLFDTYAGMTKPSDQDIDFRGVAAKKKFIDSMEADHNEWCYASMEDVRKNVLSTGYPKEKCHFIKGDVMQTLPHESLSEIAILRLDTDWYDSTLHELKHLYPLLREDGILFIDDYGYWQGCKKAVDEFFGEFGPFKCTIDLSCRLVVKPRT